MAQLPTTTADSTSAYASKGLAFTPRRQVAISRFIGFSRGLSSLNSNQFVTIAECSGEGSALRVGEVVGRTALRAVGLVSLAANYFDLAEPVDLKADQKYIAILSGDYSSPTSALNLRSYSGPANGAFLGIPADLDYNAYQFATIEPQPDDAPNAVGAGAYFVIPLPAE